MTKDELKKYLNVFDQMRIDYDENETENSDTLELEFHNCEGEGVTMDVCIATPKALVKDLKGYYKRFDLGDYIDSWYECKGTGGIPDTDGLIRAGKDNKKIYKKLWKACKRVSEGKEPFAIEIPTTEKSLEKYLQHRYAKIAESLGMRVHFDKYIPSITVWIDYRTPTVIDGRLNENYLATTLRRNFLVDIEDVRQELTRDDLDYSFYDGFHKNFPQGKKYFEDKQKELLEAIEAEREKIMEII